MQAQAYLDIRRTSQYVGLIRQLHLYIDGRDAGALANGERRVFAVSPGQHTLEVQMDWCFSPPLTVVLAEGETRELECGSLIGGWRVLFALLYLLFPNAWWYLRPARA